jgi:hypothetical protein
MTGPNRQEVELALDGQPKSAVPTWVFAAKAEGSLDLSIRQMFK